MIIIPTRPSGPDVSFYESNINWSKVEKNSQFAFMKATQGVGYNDPDYKKNMKQAKAAGIPVLGSYDFATLADNPVPEANHFVNVVKAAGGLGNGKLLVLDAEDVNNHRSQSETVNWVMTWLQTVRISSGMSNQHIIIYTGAWWWNGATGGSSKPAKLGINLWVASYTSAPISAAGWKYPLFWQFTDSYNTPGIGPSDRSSFLGTQNQLNVFANAGGIAPPVGIPVSIAPAWSNIHPGQTRPKVAILGQAHAWWVGSHYTEARVKRVKRWQKNNGFVSNGIITARQYKLITGLNAL